MLTQEKIEEYRERRNNIVQLNSNLVGIILNNDEMALDRKLEKMKADFKEACDQDVPYHMPVLRDSRIWNSDLYRFCMDLPKGSDLHVHGKAMLPMHYLIDFILNHENVLINIHTLVPTLENAGPDTMPLIQALTEGCISRKDIEQRWTMLGRKHGENAWTFFENLFTFTGFIHGDTGILFDYYEETFEYYAQRGIFHPEIHVGLYADRDWTMTILTTIREAYYAAKKKYPHLIVSVIGSGMKVYGVSMDETKAVFDNTVYAQEHLKDASDPENVCNFVLGFDLVNEEDASRPLKEYAPMLIDFKLDHPDFKYFLHCGESLNAESDNLIDAYLIDTTRVGHGMNLYRYPNLLKCYADKEICLEACLISNQSLRYTKDIRLHPGAEYLKRGVTIALCSDDPVFMEHETLTDDFFAAIISWNLGVADIKQLCLNSITHSGLDFAPRRKLLRDWNQAWKDFVSMQTK